MFLNIEKNAAEALDGKIAEGTAEIRVITRVAQQVQIGSGVTGSRFPFISRITVRGFRQKSGIGSSIRS